VVLSRRRLLDRLLVLLVHRVVGGSRVRGLFGDFIEDVGGGSFFRWVLRHVEWFVSRVILILILSLSLSLPEAKAEADSE